MASGTIARPNSERQLTASGGLQLVRNQAVTYTFAENGPFLLMINRWGVATTSYDGLYFGMAHNNGAHIIPIVSTAYVEVSINQRTVSLTLTTSTTTVYAYVIPLNSNMLGG